MTKVLMVTGDKKMFESGTESHARFKLQESVVEKLTPLFWGRGSIFPSIPEGVFDVVTVQDPFWRGLFGLYVAKKKGGRLNVQVHTDFSGVSAFRRLLARFILRRADSVRVVSERVKTQVASYTKAPLEVLPVFVDVSRFTRIERKPHEGKVILWVGRFEKEKDPLRAVSVLKKVRASDVNARLIMLGDGSLADALKREAEGLPTTFPGWQDPISYLEAADVVLNTSRSESWGASIVEALAAGVPVVAPDVGIAREAGAIVASRGKLAEAVTEALRTGAKAELKLTLPSKEEWIKRWKDAL